MSHSEEYYDKIFEEDFKCWSKKMTKMVIKLFLYLAIAMVSCYLPHIIEGNAIPYLLKNAKPLVYVQFLKGSIYGVWAFALFMIYLFNATLVKVLRYSSNRPERSDYY